MDKRGEMMEDFRKMFAEAFRLVRLRAPLVHNVTNYVAMAPSANALLAVGASPLMSSAAPEMEEISAVSDALYRLDPAEAAEMIRYEERTAHRQ